MRTDRPPSIPAKFPLLLHVQSLNTGWAAHCPVFAPDLLAYGQVRRLFRRSGGEIPGLFGFRAKLRLRGTSAKVRVFVGPLELFRSGIAWAENDSAAVELWDSLLSRSFDLRQSDESPRLQAPPPVPWMASFYSKRFQTLPLADALALAMFQRWLASVLLFRHLSHTAPLKTWGASFGPAS
jgi:hypothetical protein